MEKKGVDIFNTFHKSYFNGRQNGASVVLFNSLDISDNNRKGLVWLPVVNKYLNMFLDELLGLSLDREMYFIIKLYLGITPISLFPIV